MKTICPTKKLGEICDILDSQRKPVTKKNRKPGTYPYYGATGIQDYIADYIFDEPLVLVGEDGAKWGTGEATAYCVEGKCWVNNHAHVLRPHRDILLDGWLVYFFNISDLSEYITGLTVKKLNQEKLRSIEIPLPPLEIQKKIVGKIEGLFAKIDEASRLRAESISTSSALLPSALHHVFSRAEKEGWEVKTLDDVAEINPSKKEVVELSPDTEVSFVPMSAVSETTQSIERQEIRKLEEVKKGYTYFKEGDVLFAKITPCMENGKIVVAENLKNGIGFGSTEFHVLRAKEKVLPAWVFYFLWNPEFRKEAEENMTGTAGQQRVPSDFLKKSNIPLPPFAEQKKIVAYLDGLSQKSRSLQELQKQTADDLSALKQSILHQAFCGMM